VEKIKSGTIAGQTPKTKKATLKKSPSLLILFGGAEEDRTPDLMTASRFPLL
jgi:hypothetical protein